MANENIRRTRSWQNPDFILGKRTRFGPEDKPDDRLLNTLAKGIIAPHLGTIAKELGMRTSQFSRIQTDNAGDSKCQALKVSGNEKNQHQENVVFFEINVFSTTNKMETECLSNIG